VLRARDGVIVPGRIRARSSKVPRVLIFAIVAIGLAVIAIGGYGGRRQYMKRKGGGGGDNPSSHRGHASGSKRNRRGRGKGH
jgi:hypothetical protein